MRAERQLPAVDPFAELPPQPELLRFEEALRTALQDDAFHRLRDALYTFFAETVTPEQRLQHDGFYTYDSIADLA